MKKDIFSFFNNRKRDRRENSSQSNGRASSPNFERVSKTILNYFSTEPEKEKVLRYEDFDAAGDEYYATVSAWYKVLQRVFLVGLICFTLVSVAVNFKHITYDNFFYLIKDFNTAVDSESTNYETLSYDASSSQSFALYRGGLAVAGRSNISAFTATGRRTLNANDSYSMPYIKASDKYILVYDMGAGSFSIYNSFAKIYTEKLDYPITDACISENGRIAILTRSAKYESEVIVYNDRFERESTYRKGSYAFGISLDGDGKRLGVVYADTSDGLMSAQTVFYDLDEHEKISEYSYDGEFPVCCSFLDGGGFAAVTDSTVRIYDRQLKEKRESEQYASYTVSSVYADAYYAAVALNNGVITDENTIFVFDKKGEMVYNSKVTSDVEQMSVCDGYIFIKNSDGVSRVRIKDSSSKQLSCQSGRMLVYNKETVLVCAEAKAVYLKFDD